MPNKKRSSLYSFVLILFGIVIGLGVAALVLWSALRAPLSEAFKLWFDISLAGMFGGFLFGIRDRQLVLPRVNKNGTVNPGWIADCLYGVAGAWVVFLVIPGTFNFEDRWEIIKVLATAAIGGYGSRALIAQALNETIKKLEDRIDESIEENKVQQETDAKALALVSRHLDKTVAVSDIKAEDLKEAIKAASPTMKVQIFYMAHDLRSEYWETNKGLMERAIPVFEALIESDTSGQFHRNHGQLGYILKDKVPPDYVRARAALTKAIELRGKRDPVGFRLYELNRAICHILLDPNYTAGNPSEASTRQLILDDLKAAMTEIKTSNAIKASYQDADTPEEIAKNPIGKWMRLNDVGLEGLR
ncbi:MAG TPA: hypothetical protein PK530_15515 [Anaerolineales bacterium]|nr:hypothetical protein [Anaerolineales bacterium]